MSGVLRRVRGLFGVGVTWGSLWGLIGAGIGFAIGLIDPGAWTWENPITTWALGMGAYGFVSGVGFGGLLALREGSKTLAALSLRRVAVLGVLGGALVPPLFGLLGTLPASTTLFDMLGAIGVTSLLGGTFAPASVAIAKRAEIEAGGGPDLVGSGSGGGYLEA